MGPLSRGLAVIHIEHLAYTQAEVRIRKFFPHILLRQKNGIGIQQQFDDADSMKKKYRIRIGKNRWSNQILDTDKKIR